LILITGCSPNFEKEITRGEIQSIVQFLASDSLEGRYPGTEDDSALTHYIARQFDRAGLVAGEQEGIQTFPVPIRVKPGPVISLSVEGKPLSKNNDFIVSSFSASGTTSAPAVFAGYGFIIDTDSMQWNSYRGVDLQDCWVILFTGHPGPDQQEKSFRDYTPLRNKALEAADRGAAGVIFIDPPGKNPQDTLHFYNDRKPPMDIPILHMARQAANTHIFSQKGYTVEALQKEIEKEMVPLSLVIEREIEAVTEIITETIQTHNVFASMKGSVPSYAGEYIMIGAHHDHLGRGGKGSSSRQPDTMAIHYGADDNASGVTGVIQISENLVSRSPARSFIFATFGAEELGLLGSRYFADHPPVAINRVKTMINLDMVGRLRKDRRLRIGGVGTSPIFRSLIDTVNKKYEFRIQYSREGYGPSDHASFYAKDIPVLFISTGAHSDYHTPADTPSELNYEGMVEVISFIADLAYELGDYRDFIPYSRAGPKAASPSRHGYGEVTLGLMPDVTYEGNKGMPVMFVSEGKPAAIGGMKDGDTIKALDGKPVGNVYDYMTRLGKLEKGQNVIVTVKRKQDTLDLLIQL